MLTPTARKSWPWLGSLIASAVAAGTLAFAQAADPPKLAGTWTWTWKDRLGETHRHILEVEGVGTKLAAREVFDDQPPVRVGGLTLDGKAVKFTVIRNARKADYSGTIADPDHINGKVTMAAPPDGQSEEFEWKAERRKDIPK